MKDREIYTKAELELFKKIEAQEIIDVPKELLEQQKDFFQKSAELTLQKKTKKKIFNIRLLEDDIDKIKADALKQGLPYQTYLASMVHKIATGQLKVL